MAPWCQPSTQDITPHQSKCVGWVGVWVGVGGGGCTVCVLYVCGGGGRGGYSGIQQHV